MTAVQRAFATLAGSQMPIIPGFTKFHPTREEVDQAVLIIRRDGTQRQVRLLRNILAGTRPCPACELSDKA